MSRSDSAVEPALLQAASLPLSSRAQSRGPGALPLIENWDTAHPRLFLRLYGCFFTVVFSTMGTPAHLSGKGQNSLYDSKAVPPPGGGERGWRHW